MTTQEIKALDDGEHEGFGVGCIAPAVLSGGWLGLHCITLVQLQQL
jgi:hypothetical protein